MEQLLQDILEQCRKQISKGQVASYIPELAKADPNGLGICVIDTDGSAFCYGDHDRRFTMQSIVKPMILLTALRDSGVEKVQQLVGMEATGKPFDAFNYSDQALAAAHINPMVNTGAIALCTLISGDTYADKFQRLLDTIRTITGNPDIQVDEAVYGSEKATGSKNRALAYLLTAYGMIHDPVEQVIDCYFKACSISVTCWDLAKIGAALGHMCQSIEPDYARYVNATLMTCGMYDGSGEFALKVGFPAKSGVGGGIMGVVPGKMGIGVYSPALDRKGNSVAGVKALELLSQKLDLSIF